MAATHAPSVVVGALSAAKAGLKLAPAVLDAGVGVAQAGTNRALRLTRGAVTASSSAVRAGVTGLTSVAASSLDSRAMKEGKSSVWSGRLTRAGALTNKVVEFGSDLVEKRALGVVGTVANIGIDSVAGAAKRSLRAPRLAVAVTDKATSLALRAIGVDVQELDDAHPYERMADALIAFMEEAKRLHGSLATVGNMQLMRCIATYAKLVHVVERDALYVNRRCVRSAAELDTVPPEQILQRLQAEQDSKPKITDADALPTAHVRAAQEGAAAAPSGASKSRGWFGGWFGGSKPANSGALEGPMPHFARDPPPPLPLPPMPGQALVQPLYDGGLYALSAGGLRHSARAMLFAGAAHGSFLHVRDAASGAAAASSTWFGASSSSAGPGVTGSEYLIQECGLQAGDVLMSIACTVSHPGYVLALDRPGGRVMLVVLTGASLADVLAQLPQGKHHPISVNLGPKGQAEGYAHETMMESAQWVASSARAAVLDACKKTGMGLTLTGYGLGGGVASLLTLMWLKDSELNPASGGPARRLACFAFGAPGVVSPALAHVGFGFVWNFVLGSDVVCRLGAGTVADLCSVLLALTVDVRRQNELVNMGGKERRKKAQMDQQAKAKQMQKLEAVQVGVVAAGALHSAASNHSVLAQLLQQYDELTKGVSDASLSASSMPASAPAAGDLTPDRAQILSDLTAILLHLRSGMLHPKLVPLGRVIHLRPRSAPAAGLMAAAAGPPRGMPIQPGAASSSTLSRPLQRLQDVIGRSVGSVVIRGNEVADAAGAASLPTSGSPASTESKASMEEDAQQPGSGAEAGASSVPLRRQGSRKRKATDAMDTSDGSSGAASPKKQSRWEAATSTISSYLPAAMQFGRGSTSPQPPSALSANPAAPAWPHPAPFELVAGHWSDLCDLQLTTESAQQHNSAAYFLALATIENREEQA